MRCKICKKKFKPIIFLQKTCSLQCRREYKLTNKRIKTVSDYRRVQYKEYSALRRDFLKDNPRCQKCGDPATEIHHKAGRVGERLNDTFYFMSACRTCHAWIHDNPKQARAFGWLK